MSCEPKSPSTELILDEMRKILPLEKEELGVITELKGLKSVLSTAGDIGDVVKLAEKLFSLPDIDPLDYPLQKDGKIGKFRKSDLSDIPGVDPSKALSLKASDVNGVEKIKISLTSQTLDVVKLLKFGPIEQKIRFFITRKGYSYYPQTDQGVDTREKAIENLGDYEYFLPMSNDADIEEVKKKALESYPASKAVKSAISRSKTTAELLDELGKEGIQLMTSTTSAKELSKVLNSEGVLPPFRENDLCPTNPVEIPPFSAETVMAIEEECCGETPSIEKQEDVPVDVPEPADDVEAASEAVASYLNEMQKGSDIMIECSNERRNAFNAYMWYLEAEFLNDLAINYAEARSHLVDSLLSDFSGLIEERNSRYLLSVSLKDKENLIIAEAYKRLFPVQYSNPLAEIALTIGELEITQTRLDAVENDPFFKSDVASLRQEMTENEERIEELSSTISERYEELSLPSFTDDEKINLSIFGIDSEESVVVSRVRSIREAFRPLTSPVSNQVGFFPDNLLSIAVHESIQEEARTLFLLRGIAEKDLSDYVKKLQVREKGIAQAVWNKYYSNNQVDNLFTYQEQGYTSPKPIFSDDGKPIGETVTLKINNPLGGSEETSVSKSSADLGVDLEKTTNFWTNIEDLTRSKVLELIMQYKASDEYSSYVDTIRAAAVNEARVVFAAKRIVDDLNNIRTYQSTINNYVFDQPKAQTLFGKGGDTSEFNPQNPFKVQYTSLLGFRESIQEKLTDLDNFIEKKKGCIAEQEESMQKKSLGLAEIIHGTAEQGEVQEDCASLLGTDPIGLRLNPECPGIEKNCYWKEYTKLLQLVSVMPIPDLEFLNERLFRYYPVPFRIPIPPPPGPGVLPTMANGIPDPQISVPLPLVWKHIITVSTPVGLFVTWVTFCGPFVAPYVMYIDEKMQPCFLISPKGPVDIPDKKLNIREKEEKSFIQTIAPLDKTFRVNLSKSPFRALIGSSDVDHTDPDDPKTFLDGVRSKIKNALDSIQPRDFNLSGDERKRLREAFKSVPPDMDAINTFLNRLESEIDSYVDSISIKPIKFPKDPEKLFSPPIGPKELIETFEKMLDSKASPEELGLGISFINLRKEMKKFVDREISKPAVANSFLDINAQIVALEDFLAQDRNLSDPEKVKRRASIIREVIKKPIGEIASRITPEMLGFVAVATPEIPLPFPCFQRRSITPLPPYILALMVAIRSLPDVIDAISDDRVAQIFGKSIDLSYPLPRVEDMIYLITNEFLGLVPDLNFPNAESTSIYKQLLRSSLQDFLKKKKRPPRGGIQQIVVPGSLIKKAISATVKAAITAFVSLISREVQEADREGNLVKLLAVAAIIKGVLGTEPQDVSGEDIKSFISSSAETIDQYLEDIEKVIAAVPDTKFEFKSYKEVLFPTLPPKNSEKGPFLEISTQEMLQASRPLIQALANVTPYPLVLLGCAYPNTRLIFTKVHPFIPFEILPSWEKLTLANVPFVVWLDQMAATAQRNGGIGSSYVAPYT